MLTQRGQDRGEAVGRGEGVGVVVAEDAAAAGEGVLVEVAGLSILAQPVQAEGEGERAGRQQDVGVVVAQNPAACSASSPALL